MHPACVALRREFLLHALAIDPLRKPNPFAVDNESPIVEQPEPLQHHPMKAPGN